MATSTPITSSLFGISPESLDQQRQALQQAQAMQFAQLDPSQQAQYGFYRAGQQAGTGLSGLLGAQDPEMEAVKLVQQLGSQFDKTTPEGLNQLAQALQQTGNPYAQQFALQAADRARKLETDVLNQGKLKAEAAKAYREGMTTEQRNAGALADSKFERGTPEWQQAYNTELARLTAKPESRINYGNEAEIVSRSMFGKNFNELTAEEASKVSKELERLGVTKAKAGATSVTQTMGADAAAKDFGAKFGGLTGAAAQQVEGKYSAIDYIKEAKTMLEGGIYAGQWGPEKLLAAKVTGGLLGDKNKVERTEQFIAYIGNVVIPRLQEFGGNDSVEELKYLQSVMAGNQRLEPGSMKSILDRAERSINRGIERIKRQAGAIKEGKGNIPLDEGPSRSAPKPTMRYNIQTGQMEAVQ